MADAGTVTGGSSATPPLKSRSPGLSDVRWSTNAYHPSSFVDTFAERLPLLVCAEHVPRRANDATANGHRMVNGDTVSNFPRVTACFFSYGVQFSRINTWPINVYLLLYNFVRPRKDQLLRFSVVSGPNWFVFFVSVKSDCLVKLVKKHDCVIENRHNYQDSIRCSFTAALHLNLCI